MVFGARTVHYSVDVKIFIFVDDFQTGEVVALGSNVLKDYVLILFAVGICVVQLAEIL